MRIQPRMPHVQTVHERYRSSSRPTEKRALTERTRKLILGSTLLLASCASQPLSAWERLNPFRGAITGVTMLVEYPKRAANGQTLNDLSERQERKGSFLHPFVLVPDVAISTFLVVTSPIEWVRGLITGRGNPTFASDFGKPEEVIEPKKPPQVEEEAPKR